MFARRCIAAILCLGLLLSGGRAAAAPDSGLPQVVREQEPAGQVVFVGARAPGGMMVTADYTGGVFLWDSRSLRQIATHRRAPFPVKTAALLDRDTLLVFGSMPQDLIATIDLNGEGMHVLGRLGGEIVSVSAALPNRTVRVVIGDIASIQVLEVGAGGNVRVLCKYAVRSPSAAAISSDGRFVVVATAEKRVVLLDAGTGREVWSRPSEEPITSLAVHTAARTVLAAYDNVAAFKRKRVDQLSLVSGATVRTLALDPCSVFQVDIVDGGRGVATCGPALLDALVNMGKTITPSIVTWSLGARAAPVVTALPQATTGPLPFRTGLAWDASTRTLVAAYARGQLAALKFDRNDRPVSIERLAAAPDITQTLALGAATRQIAAIAESAVYPDQPGQRPTPAEIARKTIRESSPAEVLSDEELESGIPDTAPGSPGTLRNRMTVWDADAASGAVQVESGLGLIVDVSTAGTGAARDLTLVELLPLATSPPLASTILSVTSLAAGAPGGAAKRRLLSVDASTGLLREGIRSAGAGSQGTCVTAPQPGMVRLSPGAEVLMVACMALQQKVPDSVLAPEYDLLTFWLDPAQRVQPERVRIQGMPSHIELSGDGKLAAIVTSAQSRSSGASGSELNSTYALAIVDLVHAKAINTFTGLPQPAMGRPLAWSADGTQMCAALRGRVFRYDGRRQILEPMALQARAGVQGMISALALNHDGTLLAVSHHSGMTEVYRLTDGAEMGRVVHPGQTMSQVTFDAGVAGRLVGVPMNGGIALFDYRHGERMGNFFSGAGGAWIAMAPEGVFSGAIGAEMGMTVTDGRTAVSIDQLYDVFFRPDLLQRRLRGEHGALPSAEIVRQALAAPPPTVESTLDAVLEQRARLHVTLRDAGGGVGGLRIFHNGKLTKDMRLDDLQAAAPPAAGAARDPGRAAHTMFDLAIEVPLGAGTNDYVVAALNGARSAQSRFAKVTVEQPALAPGARKAYVLAIGTNHFIDPAFPTLALAEHSAGGLGATLVEQLSGLVGRGQVVYRELLGPASEIGKVREALRQLEQTARADDIVAIVVITHGKVLPSGELRAILADTRPDGSGALSGSELVAAVTSIPALTQMLVLDICHAGAISARVAENYQERFAIFAGSAGIHVLTSTSAEEPAMAAYDGMTVYSHFLQAGLTPGGDCRRKGHSLRAIAACVQGQVTDVIARFQHRQVPFSYSFGRDVLLP
jgi:hypothetical protein